MSRFKCYLLALSVLVIITSFLIMCSSGSKSSAPTYINVTMNGSVAFIDSADIDPADVEIGFGNNTAVIDSSSTFVIDGYQDIPGLAMAIDKNDSIPLLLCVVPSPQEGMDIDMDVHSTAVALVFMSPFICVSDADDAALVIDMIEDLTELYDFETLLESRLTENPKILIEEDEELMEALADVLEAFMETNYVGIFEKNLPAAKILPKLTGISADGIGIMPSTPYRGHQLRHKSKSTFEMTNEYGRWAFLYLPDGSKKLLPPNGQMFDFVKDGVPWAPSVTEFSLNPVAGGDTLYVHVLGCGWANDPDNIWDNLTQTEKAMAIDAGMITGLLEFCGHILTLYGNCKSFDIQHGLKPNWDDPWAIELASFVTEDGIFMVNITKMIKNGEYGKFLYALARKVLKKFVFDQQFRDFWLKAAAYTFEKAALDKMAKTTITPMLSAPVMGFMIGESMTSVMKTVQGFTSSRFKTTFKIWKDITDFGNITGSVHDKDNGEPLEGATVTVLGEGNNPLNPALEATTDAAGGFYFENISVGEKQLQASKTGYKTALVDITVVEDITISRTIELEKISGQAAGRVLDEIYVENNQPDSLFKKDLSLLCREIGGESRQAEYTIEDGAYTVNLFPGQWWIIARHDDYHNDSAQITIEEEQVTGVRDLLMRPIVSMTADFRVDMNNDGVYESNYSLTFDRFYADTLQPPPPGLECPTGESSVLIPLLAEVRGTDDRLLIMFNATFLNPNSSLEDLGDFMGAICKNGAKGGAIEYLTDRFQCTEDDGDHHDMVFHQIGGPYYGEECGCGMTNLGSLMFFNYGEEMTDLIHGSAQAYVPGWASCYCEPIDSNQDGTIDEWKVTCAKAQIDIEFRIMVGTSYLWNAAASSNDKNITGIMGEFLNRNQNKE